MDKVLPSVGSIGSTVYLIPWPRETQLSFVLHEIENTGIMPWNVSFYGLWNSNISGSTFFLFCCCLCGCGGRIRMHGRSRVASRYSPLCLSTHFNLHSICHSIWSLSVELGLSANGLQEPPCFCLSPNNGIIRQHHLPSFHMLNCWSSRLRSSCLWRRHLTDGVISWLSYLSNGKLSRTVWTVPDLPQELPNGFSVTFPSVYLSVSIWSTQKPCSSIYTRLRASSMLWLVQTFTPSLALP